MQFVSSRLSSQPPQDKRQKPALRLPVRLRCRIAQRRQHQNQECRQRHDDRNDRKNIRECQHIGLRGRGRRQRRPGLLLGKRKVAVRGKKRADEGIEALDRAGLALLNESTMTAE